jgi:hypothetical protein
MILETILETLADGEVKAACVGLHWTAVVVEVNGERQCGLAATLSRGHEHSKGAQIPQAGNLEGFSARQLAEFALHESPTLVSIGMAAINALLPKKFQYTSEVNAEQLILQHGLGKRVALVGHFPFVPDLREQLGHLDVLELEPQPGDLPASMAPEVLPGADVVAITAMTLVNGTMESMLALCSPGAYVILLGPSAPLTPLLFDFGIDAVSGALVTSEEPVLKTIMQGGNFHQVHRAGVRLVNLV